MNGSLNKTSVCNTKDQNGYLSNICAKLCSALCRIYHKMVLLILKHKHSDINAFGYLVG